MPENWKIFKLNDIAKNVSRRFDFNKHQKVVFINTSDVLEGKFLHNEIKVSYNLPGQAKKAIKKGDILFSEIRPKNKRYAFVDFDTPNYVVSTKFMVIQSNNEIIDNKFFLQLLTSNQRLDEFQSIAEGRSGTFPQITFDAIADVEFFLPPLQEQKAIASILSALDDKIELNLQMNKTLEEMAMALYKHWFVDFGPFQNGNFVDSELGMIPEGWEVSTIEDLLSIKPINGLYKKAEFQGFGNRWLKMKSVYGLDIVTFQEMELINVTEKEIIKYGCLYDDIVFGRTSLVLEGIGKCAIIKCQDNIPIFESNLFRIRPNKNKINPNILFQYFISSIGRDEVKKLARQTAAVSITSKDLICIKIALPNIITQNICGNKISDLISKIICNIEENQTLTNLRNTLLPKLISGEIRVKDVEEMLAASL
jgi:type I restriction enzyme S subunit